MFNDFDRIVHQCMARDGVCESLMFVFDQNGSPEGFSMAAYPDKHEWIEAILLGMLNCEHCIGVIAVFEAWVTTTTGDDKRAQDLMSGRVAVHELPEVDRREVVIIQLHKPNKEIVTNIYPITRDGGKAAIADKPDSVNTITSSDVKASYGFELFARFEQLKKVKKVDGAFWRATLQPNLN
jgi:hypothetical protein